MSKQCTVVVSDLHLGAGHDGPGGNPLEDFISDPEFSSLLRQLGAESERDAVEMQLIINGDFLEMLQVPATPTYSPQEAYPTSIYEDNSAAGSVLKLRHIMAGHAGLFTALHDFLNPDPPRRALIVLKGNHDPEWYWPAVQNALRRRLDAVGPRERCLRFLPVAYQQDGLYVEHGNQYTERVDRFANFARPVDPEDRSRLELLPGSRFVIEYFNEIEAHYPWIDGVHPVVDLIWYGLKFDFPFAIQALLKLLTVAPILILPGFMPADARPADEATTAFLADLQRTDGESSKVKAIRYAGDADFRQQFNRQVWQALAAAGWLDEKRDKPADFDDPFVIGQAIAESSNAALVEKAEALSQDGRTKVVIFGHTHQPGVYPLANGAMYINSGTWVWRGDFSRADEATWRDLFANPQKYANQRHLTYVRVDREGERWQATLQTFHAGGPQPAPEPVPTVPPTPTPLPGERSGCLGWLGRLFGRKKEA